MEKKLLNFLDWVMITAFSAIIVLVTGMALLRYIFQAGMLGGAELGRFLYIFTSSIGAGILLRRNEHIGLDMVIDLFPAMVKKIIIILNNLIIAIANAFLIYLSVSWIEKTGMTKNEVFRFPMKYIQIFLPIGFLLVVFFSIFNVYDNINALPGIRRNK